MGRGTTVEIKLAFQNFKNSTLICIFYFRREGWGHAAINTAATVDHVMSFLVFVE